MLLQGKVPGYLTQEYQLPSLVSPLQTPPQKPSPVLFMVLFSIILQLPDLFLLIIILFYFYSYLFKYICYKYHYYYSFKILGASILEVPLQINKCLLANHLSLHCLLHANLGEKQTKHLVVFSILPFPLGFLPIFEINASNPYLPLLSIDSPWLILDSSGDNLQFRLVSHLLIYL